jgi:hypothetical protein
MLEAASGSPVMRRGAWLRAIWLSGRGLVAAFVLARHWRYGTGVARALLHLSFAVLHWVAAALFCLEPPPVDLTLEGLRARSG